VSLITTVDRVRNRRGFTTSDLTDSLLEQFIRDQQAFLEDPLDKTFTEGDDGFELACSVVTDLSAIITLLRFTGTRLMVWPPRKPQPDHHGTDRLHEPKDNPGHPSERPAPIGVLAEARG
jgi:hypothetical protein